MIALKLNGGLAYWSKPLCTPLALVGILKSIQPFRWELCFDYCLCEFIDWFIAPCIATGGYHLFAYIWMVIIISCNHFASYIHHIHEKTHTHTCSYIQTGNPNQQMVSLKSGQVGRQDRQWVRNIPPEPNDLIHSPIMHHEIYRITPFYNNNVHICAYFCHKLWHSVIWGWCLVRFELQGNWVGETDTRINQPRHTHPWSHECTC